MLQQDQNLPTGSAGRNKPAPLQTLSGQAAILLFKEVPDFVPTHVNPLLQKKGHLAMKKLSFHCNETVDFTASYFKVASR